MSLPRRLFIAFLLIVAVGLICWVVLPRYGIWAPPEVVFIGYLVILLSCALAAGPRSAEEDEELDESPQAGDRDDNDPPIAGRIGPS